MSRINRYCLVAATLGVILLMFALTLLPHLQARFDFLNPQRRALPEAELSRAFYLSPDLTEGDKSKMEDRGLADTPPITDLSDLPSLFPRLRWRASPAGPHEEIVPYISEQKDGKTQKVPLKGDLFIGEPLDRDKISRIIYQEFIDYNAVEFFKRGWGWPYSIQNSALNIKAYISESPRIFTSKAWSYIGRKDDQVRAVTFYFDKKNNRFLIFVSEVLALQRGI